MTYNRSSELSNFIETSDLLCEKLREDRTEEKSKELSCLASLSGTMSLLSQLKESEQRFFKLFYYSPMATCLVSKSGYFIDVNPACVELWGYERSELLAGMRWQDITLPEDIKPDQEKVDASIIEKAIEKQEIFKVYIHKNGTHELCYLQYIMIRDDKGEVMYFISSILSDKIINSLSNRFKEEKDKRGSGGGISH